MLQKSLLLKFGESNLNRFSAVFTAGYSTFKSCT